MAQNRDSHVSHPFWIKPFSCVALVLVVLLLLHGVLVQMDGRE